MEQRLKSALAKQKILDAAEIEFAQNGLAGARVDSVAARAGVNKQLIYAYFQSKDLLCTAVLERVYSRLGEYEQKLSESEFEGVRTIRWIVLEYFDFLMNNPSFVRLVLWENLNYARNSDGIHTTLFYGIRKLLCAGVQKGVLRSDLDVDQTAMSMNMFCFSAFSNIHTVSKLLHKDLSQKEEMEKRAEHIADVFNKYVL